MDAEHGAGHRVGYALDYAPGVAVDQGPGHIGQVQDAAAAAATSGQNVLLGQS